MPNPFMGGEDGGGDLDIGLGIIEWNINCLLAVSWMDGWWARRLVGCFLVAWFVRLAGSSNLDG